MENLDTNKAIGLSSDKAESRFIEHGPNQLIQTPDRGPWRILWEQLNGAMVILLFVAAAVSTYLHEYTDTVVILIIIVLNATLGFIQDYRAEKALAALKSMAVPLTRVRRDGKVSQLSSRVLVPGDLVLLEVGQYVPADCRLCDSVNLKINEAALTGESVPIEKQTAPLTQLESPLGDRNNMAHLGTLVTYGHGEAIVTATGMNTELGQIAQSLQTVESEPTPLQKRLTELGRSLAVVAVGIVSLVFLMGLVRGEGTQIMLMTALSMAVAVVPEGLPAVATVALAIGAGRMFERHALIRKLPAVETLGSVTVICSDKTGTLTENRMKVTTLDVAEECLDLSQGLHHEHEENSAEQQLTLQQQIYKNRSFSLLLTGARLCNDVELEQEEHSQDFKASGDPTEIALAIAATRFGFNKEKFLTLLPRVEEIPFDSDRKRMTTIHQLNIPADLNLKSDDQSVLHHLQAFQTSHLAITKGAVDVILDSCQYMMENNKLIALNENWRHRIEIANEKLAAKGMRILGLAVRPINQSEMDDIPLANLEQKLIFIGLFGLTDPPRPQVAESVLRCRSAGIRPVMITGDHPLTALHIARQLQMTDDDHVLSGQDLDGLNESEIREAVQSISVYARVAPKHKLELVQALQKNGEIVAMTGDGVNDAPALKQAHIGVSMGIAGTDVSKEASQMILLDDNFATIVNAVEEGRIVYDNIRKYVKYTMTSNAGEVWVMVLGPMLGMPLPLLPLQILWINLVTDGLPGLALALEHAERDTMRRPPHPPHEHIMSRGMWGDIAWIGLLMGVVSLAMGYAWWTIEATSETHWRTILFTVLTLSQMGNALAIRSSSDSLFQIGVFSNKAMIGSVLLTFCLQLGVIYWPPLQRIFHTTSLQFNELLACLLVSTLLFWAIEVQKLWSRSSRGD